MSFVWSRTKIAMLNISKIPPKIYSAVFLKLILLISSAVVPATARQPSSGFLVKRSGNFLDQLTSFKCNKIVPATGRQPSSGLLRKLSEIFWINSLESALLWQSFKPKAWNLILKWIPSSFFCNFCKTSQIMLRRKTLTSYFWISIYVCSKEPVIDESWWLMKSDTCQTSKMELLVFQSLTFFAKSSALQVW